MSNLTDPIRLADGSTVEVFDHDDDAPDLDDVLLEPLSDVRRYIDTDDDPWQLDRIEAKLDAVLAGADAMREATEPIMAAMGSGGGLMSLLGGMMGGR